MTDEAKIAQQGTQIRGDVVWPIRYTECRKCGASNALLVITPFGRAWDCGSCGALISQPGDSPARHGGSSPLETITRGIATGEIPVARGDSSAAETRADQSDAASGSAQPRGVVPAPAQGLETASGGHSLLSEREMDVLDDYLAAHRDDIEHDINDFGDLRPLLPWLDGVWPRP